jgi:hypothetical protein
METTDARVYRFETSAKASADARALEGPGLARFDLILDAVALVAAVVLVATGNVLLGLLVAGIALLSLVGARFHPLQRVILERRYGSLLGQVTEVTIDGEGVRFENPLGSSFVPWETVTAVRTSRDTVAFFRGNALLGSLPASSFDSPAEQAEVVAFAEGRIAPSGRRS